MIYALYFFTFWNILLVIFHQYTHRHVNLLFLSFMCLVIGSYLSFINPRLFLFQIGEEKIYLTGLHKLIIVDIFAHLLPFLFIYVTYSKYYENQNPLFSPLTLLIVFIYGILINHQRVYRASILELSIVSLISYCLYFLL